MAWDGHANVEYSGSTYTVLYLYKYLFKGAKKVSVRFIIEDDVRLMMVSQVKLLFKWHFYFTWLIFDFVQVYTLKMSIYVICEVDDSVQWMQCGELTDFKRTLHRSHL